MQFCINSYFKNIVQLHAYVVAHLNIVHITVRLHNFAKLKGYDPVTYLWSKIKNMHDLAYFT